MQIVISIPEEKYKNAISGKFHTPTFYKAVQNGIPLPKGHGDLIDKNEYFQGTFNDAREFLDMATTIIEADTEPMYYPQVDGITPTVVTESEGKNEVN